MNKFRTESDSLGSKEIPFDAYYGVQTLRALENFCVTGVTMTQFPDVMKALAAIKQAAALANCELGSLSQMHKEAIISACKEVYAGKFDDQFPVDMIQGGAGTSANMNANEVIANRGLELMGHHKGQYHFLHPNDHVNQSQSTNDVYPTACKIAMVWAAKPLIDSLSALRDAFLAKGEEFKRVIKMGRTQLQDAVPMTLGQEFKAFAATLDADLKYLKKELEQCHEINMGATAIGTGINTFPSYSKLVCKHLGSITQLPLFEARDLIEATSSASAFIAASSGLKRIAVKLTKICNDLRLLSSGPKAGLGDINLPPMQPGSSIMPGKVNPVIPEVVNQICFQVIGFDLAITQAASGGQMQLNAFEPLMLYDVLQSMDLLTRGCLILQERCIEKITANEQGCKEAVYSSSGLLTAFAPYIGYEEAAKIAKLVQHSNRSVYDLIKESNLLTDEQIRTILSPEFMTRPQEKLDIQKKKSRKTHE